VEGCKSEADIRTLQDDLSTLDQRSEKWLLQFNIKKCKVMHFGKNTESHYYLTNNGIKKEIEVSKMEKDLGVWVNNELKWSDQCGKAAGKAMSVLGVTKRSFKRLDIKSFKILFNIYVRPHLEYCIQAWCPYYEKDINCFEKIQRRATKLISDVTHLAYHVRLQKLNLFTLEQRRVRGDLTETYKIFRGFDNVDCSKFFTPAPVGITRGNSL